MTCPYCGYEELQIDGMGLCPECGELVSEADLVEEENGNDSDCTKWGEAR